VPIDHQRLIARRRRGKKLMMLGLAGFASFVAATFATGRLLWLAPAIACWLFTCGAAVYTGRAPPGR
jgi:TctA family transporter